MGLIMARPKSACSDDIATIHKRANMLRRGAEILDERWDEVVDAMIDCATKKKSVMAATWLRDTFIGKPKEQVELSNEVGKSFELSYKLGDK